MNSKQYSDDLKSFVVFLYYRLYGLPHWANDFLDVYAMVARMTREEAVKVRNEAIAEGLLHYNKDILN